MSNLQHDEQDELQKYLEEKAKEEQEDRQQQEAEALSEYEACVLRESARVKELIAEAQSEAGEGLEDK